MRSFLSFAFLRPAKAILVPGMYWIISTDLIQLSNRKVGGVRLRSCGPSVQGCTPAIVHDTKQPSPDHLEDRSADTMDMTEIEENKRTAAHLLGVLEVLEKSVVVLIKSAYIPSIRSLSRLVTHPGNALVDVGGGVGETLDLTRLSSEKTVEVRSDLVGLSGTEGVALSTSGL
jgi:hypothetical protein